MTKQHPDLGDAFWDYSCALYARPGAAEACLRLQDRDGLNVNLLLFCLWAGAAFGRASPANMARAKAMAARWDDVLKPLREARRAAKPLSGAPYERLKAVELEAERAHQRELAPLGAMATGPGGREAATASLRAYACAIGRQGATDMNLLLDLAFSGGLAGDGRDG